MRGLGPNATAPPLFQTASVNIDDMNTRAILIAEGGAEFEINERGIFPVKRDTNGRRLQNALDFVADVATGVAHATATTGQNVGTTLVDGTNTLVNGDKSTTYVKTSCTRNRTTYECADRACKTVKKPGKTVTETCKVGACSWCKA